MIVHKSIALGRVICAVAEGEEVVFCATCGDEVDGGMANDACEFCGAQRLYSPEALLAMVKAEA